LIEPKVRPSSLIGCDLLAAGRSANRRKSTVVIIEMGAQINMTRRDYWDWRGHAWLSQIGVKTGHTNVSWSVDLG
jgi:hypothetical protein